MYIEKHIKLTGNSTVSWKDAILKTISEASKSINNISSIKIDEQFAKISENKIIEYFVIIDLTFKVNNS